MHIRTICLMLVCAAGTPAMVHAQTNSAAASIRTARHLESVKNNTPQLYAMLREMPKGGDLHSHLSGAVYAESFLAWAAEDRVCIRLSDLIALGGAETCDNNAIRADTLMRNQALYDRIVDEWSTRNWRRESESGHYQFFATFGKFGGTTRNRTGDMIAEVMRRAHAGNVRYLELMNTPNDGAANLGESVGWTNDFAQMRERLRNAAHAQVVARARADVASWIAKQRQLLRCDVANPDPACSVTVRFLYQVSRGRAPERVFAQIMTAFEVANVDSMVVGFNLVQPEDGFVSMRDYSLQMRMIEYLRQFYPNVKIALHAGELAPGLVPPEGLRFHIREAVEIAGASRIGHGVDIMYEDRPVALMREMARRDVAVEINLTSNHTILDVSGRDHPLAAYHRYNVPTLLSTDDEGVSRSEMTMEYVRAVQDQGLSYARLKEMSINSLKYAFLQEPVKSRLLAELRKDFAAFERKF
jgi:adenosine deaminase